MKILVISQYYYPESFQITPICEQLASHGHDVTVLTGLPNYPVGRVLDEYKKGHRDEYINNVHVIRSYEIGRRKGAFWLGVNYFSFCLSSLWRIRRLDADFDCVFVYQLSPVLMGLAGRKYARKHNVPMLLYCCDIWPESVKVYVKSEKNPIFWFSKTVSKIVYGAADKIATQSNSFIPYLKEVDGILEEKMVYLPTFADDRFLTVGGSVDNGVTDFVFLGNLGEAQDLFSVLAAIEKIRDIPGFKVHFVGDGSCKQKLEEQVREKGLQDLVSFYGWRSPEEILPFYEMADFCLVSLADESRVGLTCPSKVQGYMAAGRPVIGMIDGSAREVISDAACGVCVPAGDVDGLARAMKDAIVAPEEYAGCGAAGRQYFLDNFSKSVFMQRLEGLMDAVTSEKNNIVAQ